MSADPTLPAWQQKLLDLAEDDPGPKFMKIPDRWLDNPHFRCENDHVSTMILRCEEGPRDRCLACHSPTMLTFPEDVDGPLPGMEDQ